MTKKGDKKNKLTWELSRDRQTLFVTLEVDMQELAQTLMHVSDRGTLSNAALDLLTKREQQTLELLINGSSGKEIAEALDVSIRTAKYHSSNVYGKLGVHGRNGLMLLTGPRKILQTVGAAEGRAQ